MIQLECALLALILVHSARGQPLMIVSPARQVFIGMCSHENVLSVLLVLQDIIRTISTESAVSVIDLVKHALDPLATPVQFVSQDILCSHSHQLAFHRVTLLKGIGQILRWANALLVMQNAKPVMDQRLIHASVAMKEHF